LWSRPLILPWLPGLRQFDGGGAAEFAAAEDERFFEHAALFQVFEERGDGFVALFGESAVAGFDVVVVVPGLARAVPELDESDAAFEQAPRDEQLARVDAVAVHLADVGGFFADVEGVGAFHLHAVGEFEGLDAGF
jgi:hypothetical protein